MVGFDNSHEAEENDGLMKNVYLDDQPSLGCHVPDPHGPAPALDPF